MLFCISANAQSFNNPIKGDINEDGVVNAADVITLVNIIINGEKPVYGERFSELSSRPECLENPNKRVHEDPTPYLSMYWMVEDYSESLENFRTTYSEFVYPSLDNYPPQFEKSYIPSIEGLYDLNISGSGEFSPSNIEDVINRIRVYHEGAIAVVDLRSETHGYLNKMAVYPWSLRSWCNIGKTSEDIVKEERNILRSLEGDDLYVHQTAKDSMLWSISTTLTEEELCNQYGLTYKRIASLDYAFPSDDVIEDFVNYIRCLPKNVWLHFHCKRGKGRTVLFMSFYDMMRNPTVPLKDIVYRQYLIGGPSTSFLLNDGSNETVEWKKEFLIEKSTLTPVFYDYVQAHWRDNFSVSFSQWKAATYK